MTALLTLPEWQLLDANGAPLAGGSVFTYVPGTTTAKATWQDAAQATANTNPVVLDAAGRCIVFGAGTYRIVVKDAADNLIYDQLSSSSLDESAVSAVMLPVIGAATLQTARDLMGVSSAIATAIAAIGVIQGPKGDAGSQGVQGIQGIQGVQGPAGTVATGSSISAYSNTTPGYIIFSNALYLQWGGIGANTDGSGGSYQNRFPVPFPSTCAAIVSNAQLLTVTPGEGSSFSVLASVAPKDNASFYYSQADGTGAAGCYWFAVGF